MSRVRNAADFLHRFRKLHADYHRMFVPEIAQVRQKFAESDFPEIPPHVDDSLEFHARTYIINALLEALNWRLNTDASHDLPNLVPEVPLTSQARGTRRFLDYLGFERYTHRPLLVVEAKRPTSSLPNVYVGKRLRSETHLRRADAPTEVLKPTEVAGYLVRGLSGERLTGDWNAWLGDLQDYVRSVYRFENGSLRRAVITNGDWLVLFLNPFDAFTENGTRDANQIIVFRDRAEIESNHTDLFLNLAHQYVVRSADALTPGDVAFAISADAIDKLMHGVLLCYCETPAPFESFPSISVAPVLFLHSRYDPWIRVEAPPEHYLIPRSERDLDGHLRAVATAAQSLLRDINQRLGTQLKPSPLTTHYEEGDLFDGLHGVIEQHENRYLIVTGDKTHYLMGRSSVPNCPHHDWVRSARLGFAATTAPIMRPSVSPRAFFTSGMTHHCAHRDVISAKSNQVTPEDRARYGPRSGDAFCEIWPFDNHLCCRTCVFEDVCTKAEVFRLPCARR